MRLMMSGPDGNVSLLGVEEFRRNNSYKFYSNNDRESPTDVILYALRTRMFLDVFVSSKNGLPRESLFMMHSPPPLQSVASQKA